jgi:hypothetical protein
MGNLKNFANFLVTKLGQGNESSNVAVDWTQRWCRTLTPVSFRGPEAYALSMP